MSNSNIALARSLVKNTSKFFTDVAGATSKIIDVAPKITGRGDLLELEDIEVIINSILVGITTIKGTYPFDPEFGLGLQLYLFEPLDDITIREIESEIYSFIRKYEPNTNATVQASATRDPNSILIKIIVEYKGETRTRKLILNDTLLKSPEELD